MTKEELKNKLLEEYSCKNCYTCKHRGSVVGSAHSSCTVFKEQKTIEMLSILLSTQGAINPTSIKVTFDADTEEEFSLPAQEWSEHGLRNGWVVFPINFDPTWLKYCLFYVPLSKPD
jgi:hypothetical protein